MDIFNRRSFLGLMGGGLVASTPRGVSASTSLFGESKYFVGAGVTSRIKDVRMSAGESIHVAIPNQGVPIDRITALNATFTHSENQEPTYLTAWGRGPRPKASMINAGANADPIANSLTVPVYIHEGQAQIQVFSLRDCRLMVDYLGLFLQ